MSKLGGHLTSTEIADAVFYHPKDLREGVDYVKISQHLKKCDFCSSRVDEEQKANPLYEGYMRAVDDGTVKEFWRQVYVDYLMLLSIGFAKK